MEIHNTRLIKKSSYNLNDLHGISKKCDWFIYNEKILKNNIIPKIIFITNYTGRISIPFFYHKILNTLKNPIILIIASEDNTFPKGIGDLRCNFFKNFQKEINILINHKNIKKIYVENLDTIHPKLHPLPLGILYHKQQKLYQDLLNFKKIDFNKKNITLFCCHRYREHLQFNDRKITEKYCKNNWKDFTTFKDTINEIQFKNYLIQSKFCLCIHGGGYDPSPKCWQALLCGSIPIIQSSPLNKAYQEFPVIILNDLNSNSITKEKLDLWLKQKRIYFENENYRKQILKKLLLDYHWKKIIS